MAVSVVRAQADDLSEMAEVNRKAYCGELVHRFAFPGVQDDNVMHDFFKARIATRFDDARTVIFKAVEDSTGELAGFACWTLEAINDVAPPPTNRMVRESPPPSMNVELVMAAGTLAEDLGKYREAESHYYLSAFAVNPSRQGRGIGTQLLRRCLELADQATLPSWLIALPGSHSLYVREGFTDIDHRDIDLNAWDQNRHRGYGIYRQYAMVRRPPV